MLPTTFSFVTTDGVRLDADCYRPAYSAPEDPLPVLLMRQPYGRAIASTVVYAHPSWYAAQGYMVIIQDVRGRGSSEGDFRLFANETADSLETIAWAAQLPGSNGRVGMYGFSYQGMTQLYGAKAPALVTLAPAMVGYDLHGDWAYEGGAFLGQLNLAWAIQMAAETARRQGDGASFERLNRAAQHLPLDGAIPWEPDLLRELAPDSFYWDWLTHGASPQPIAHATTAANTAETRTDPNRPSSEDISQHYWQTLQPDLSGINLPMLHIGGWFDPYLRGTLRLYRQQKAQSSQPQELWLGPWGHLPWGRRVGAVDLGAGAVSPIDRVQLQWFDYWLKGNGTPPQDQAPIHWFEMGGRGWRTGDLWPQILGQKPDTRQIFTQGGSQEFQFYYFQGNGLGAIAGNLLFDEPPHQPNLAVAADVLVQDPWRPVPARGGHGALPSGSFDRSDLDDRGDVATYTTPALTQALVIFGETQITLHYTSAVPSFDLCAVLSVVRPEGVFNFSQGYQRITEVPVGESRSLQFTLQATGQRLQPGEQLRLSLSLSCYPAYAVNPGTGESPERSARLETQVVTVAIEQGLIILPLAH